MFDVAPELIGFLEQLGIFGDEKFTEFREIAGQFLAIADRSVSNRPRSPLWPVRSAAAWASFGTLERRSFSITRLADTFTLLRTLPTLCSTPVATSAMPASRDVSTNFCCDSRNASSASRRSVMSRMTVEKYSRPPSAVFVCDQDLRNMDLLAIFDFGWPSLQPTILLRTRVGSADTGNNLARPLGMKIESLNPSTSLLSAGREAAVPA